MAWCESRRACVAGGQGRDGSRWESMGNGVIVGQGDGAAGGGNVKRSFAGGRRSGERAAFGLFAVRADGGGMGRNGAGGFEALV